ncbi:hypothetical protein IT774_05490 [Salinimonas marina]|uniref:DNA polymerase III tau subunit domain-containing protein n=1 Tax=Salinimonas marina TaxID=2785918 RepID=A0A7S9DZN5_9ALTE|nr:DNA polymerase III subunit gamma/tau C-terminal domain-containing protein [Salinimonas marina]QPG06618.1 hypothetical protein IT774_05490 [Salinimonas marina]
MPDPAQAHASCETYSEAPTQASQNLASAPVADETYGGEGALENSQAQAASVDSQRPVPSQAAPTELASIDSNEALSAYLPDGSKLVDANQIDDWSRLISSMPVAGLVKQIVLHSAYKKKDNQVMLELDPGQTHLLNDNSQEQVARALSDALGEQIQLDIQIGKPGFTPFSIQQKINAMRQQHAEWVVSNDEQFQSLISSFNASVVAQSVKAR